MTTQQNQILFAIEKIYVKDASLEVPNSPQIFLNKGQHQVELNLSFSTTKIDENVYQTVLKGVVSSKIETTQAFLIEVEQSGIFRIQNIPEEQLNLLFNVECPTILFPYLREVVSDLIVKSGFNPVLLAPVNFMALYQEQIKKNQESKSDSDTVN